MSPRGLVLVFLAAIVLGFGAAALVQPETRPFTPALSAAAAVLFLLVSVSRFDFRPSRASARPSSSGRKRLGLILLAACGSLIGVVLLLPGWAPRADFDVVGVLWVMQNVVRITTALALATGALVGLALWRQG